jgi:phosphoribosylglycinamide formyltransferase-1
MKSTQVKLIDDLSKSKIINRKSKMNKIAVFASGSGTNFQAFIDAVAQGTLQADIVLLFFYNSVCMVVQRAKKHHIDIFSFNPKTYPSKDAFEQEIVKILRQKEVDLIVLAGYMRLIGNVLLCAFEGKIVNIHPSLLPAFPGLHAIEKAYQHGVKVFGITIHYVDKGMDTGTIIAQDSFHIVGNETLEEVENRIHQLEHQLYPKTIQKLLNLKS